MEITVVIDYLGRNRMCHRHPPNHLWVIQIDDRHQSSPRLNWMRSQIPSSCIGNDISVNHLRFLILSPPSVMFRVCFVVKCEPPAFPSVSTIAHDTLIPCDYQRDTIHHAWRAAYPRWGRRRVRRVRCRHRRDELGVGGFDGFHVFTPRLLRLHGFCSS